MVRAFLFFLVLFAIVSGIIFGYKYVTKSDVKVTGKLIVAAIVTLFFTTVIFLLENQ